MDKCQEHFVCGIHWSPQEIEHIPITSHRVGATCHPALGDSPHSIAINVPTRSLQACQCRVHTDALPSPPSFRSPNSPSASTCTTIPTFRTSSSAGDMVGIVVVTSDLRLQPPTPLIQSPLYTLNTSLPPLKPEPLGARTRFRSRGSMDARLSLNLKSWLCRLVHLHRTRSH